MSKTKAKDQVVAAKSKRKASSSSSSSSSSSDDDAPALTASKTKQTPKQPAAKPTPVVKPASPVKPAVVNSTPSKQVPANKFPKRQRESSSSSSESSEDEHVEKKTKGKPAAATPAPVTRNTTPVHKTAPAPVSKPTPAPVSKPAPAPVSKPATPAHVPTQNNNTSPTKLPVTVSVNTNFQTPCPSCGKKLEINLSIC